MITQQCQDKIYKEHNYNTNDPEHDVITKENINLQTTATTSTNSIKLATAEDIDEEEEEALIEPPDEIVVHTSTLV